MKDVIESCDLKLAPKDESLGSYFKVMLFSLLVAATMVVETAATVLLGQYISTALFGLNNASTVTYIICFGQITSYILSPMLCRNSGRVDQVCEYETTERKWKQAKPLTVLDKGFHPADQVLWWGPLGMFIFAPAIWKMQWAGKTIFGQDLVHMLEFKAINRIPTPKFALPILGNAYVGKDDFEGKTSVAFCYKFLPIIDHLRKLDDNTIIGKMKIGTVTIIYFTLIVPKKIK